MAVTIMRDDVEEGRTASSLCPGRIYVTDLRHRAFFCSMEWREDRVVLYPPDERPVTVHVRMDVPGFGACWLTMDREGRGYTSSDKSYSLLDELITSRGAQVERKRPTPRNEQCVGYPEWQGKRLGVLASLVLEGEDLEFELATRRLGTVDSRNRDVFSATYFGERNAEWCIGVGKDWPDGTEPPDFLRPRSQWPLIAEVFGATTLPNFWRWIEPERGQYNFAGMDEIVRFCRERSITMKSFALYWGGIGGQPLWVRRLDFKRQMAEIRRWVTMLIERYGEHIGAYETVNEMHQWWFANTMRYGQRELMEITANVNAWVGELDPGKPRIINNCCPWGEYKQEFQGEGWVPLTYIDDVVANDVQFEAIGLQYYNPGRDMMELSRHIDRFAEFGKDIYITEMGTPSAPGDAAAVATGQVDPMNGWRGVWSEIKQADWVEYFYSIALAKEAIRMMNYWDVDDARAFIGQAGLLDGNGVPKLSFQRLKELGRKYSSS